jgi:hypothetical protein
VDGSEAQDIRSEWGLEEQLAHERELAEGRRRWEERRKFEKEQAERDRKRQALEGYLKLRSERYLDITGSSPGEDTLAQWAQEYIDDRMRQEEAEKEARRQRSEDENYDFNSW